MKTETLFNYKMKDYRECLMLIYFSCLFFNIWLVKYYKYCYLCDIMAFLYGSFLLTNEPTTCHINLTEYERPSKKRKLSPIRESREIHVWHDDYWDVHRIN